MPHAVLGSRPDYGKQTTETRMSNNLRKPLGLLPSLIFSSRWLQLPLYLGLIVAQGVYVFLFLKELWHLIHSAPTLTE